MIISSIISFWIFVALVFTISIEYSDKETMSRKEVVEAYIGAIMWPITLVILLLISIFIAFPAYIITKILKYGKQGTEEN